MKLNRMDDAEYLKNKQYKDARNLEARIALHRDFNTNAYPWMRWVFDQMELQPGMQVLEVGSGPGGLWAENGDRLPHGLQLCLGDFSLGMLQKAQANLPDAPGVTCAVMDAQALPFPAASFDLVVANHMLYHVPDIARAVRELRRVLKPGGRLISATNGLRHMAELAALALEYEDAATSVWSRQAVGRFCLENGAEILGASFSEVTRRDYLSDLEVTRVEPLVAYLKSMSSIEVTPDIEAQIRLRLEQHFAQQPSFHISKASGLFLAK
jgi:ubiquinone/menaquinone biosynthesis C-methylase UbiE